MQVEDRVVVVTGGGSGIGAALCRVCAARGAAAVVVADIDLAAAEATATGVGGSAVAVDVAHEDEVRRLVDSVLDRHGRVDIYCSNAGIALGAGIETPNEIWQRNWDIHVMAHVYAARALLPGMLQRGEGYIVGTVSAAALLTNVLAAPYSATKAAALAFLEWLAIAYGEQGLRVSALCPEGVRTPMLELAGEDNFLAAGAMEAEQVAAATIDAIGQERFLVLTHPHTQEYFVRRAADHERWLGGMRRLRRDAVAR